MRTDKQFYKSIALATLLGISLASVGIAQDASTMDDRETKAPVVLTTTPTGGEMNADLNSSIEITFNSEMDESTINGNTLLLHATSADSMFEMHSEMLDDKMNGRSAMKDSEESRQNTKDAVNGTISYSNKVAVFTPDKELKEGTQYTFTVTKGVKSMENIALKNDHYWSFTTTGTSDSTYTDMQNDDYNMKSTSDPTYSDKQNNNYSMKGTSDSTHTDKQNNNYSIEGTSDSAYTDMKNDNYDMKSTSDSSYSDRQNDKYDMDSKDYSKSTTDASQKNKINMINLGKAGHYVILAKTNINKESESMITGQTGEGSVADSLNNEKEASDSERQANPGQAVVFQSNQSDTTTNDVNEAIEDMMSAYSDASMQDGDSLTTHNTESFHHDPALNPGVHKWDSSIQITSDVTLSGSADDVWVFKTGNNLTVDENIEFTLNNGARAENIFWVVEGDVTIGNNANFEGIILSMNEITLEKGAKLKGRMFSQTSVTLDDNTVTEPRSMAGQTSSTNK